MADDLNLAMRLYLEAHGFTAGLTRSGRELQSWSRGARRDIGSVRENFDAMTRHFTVGLAALAGDHYLIKPLRKGVDAAADLQESLLSVKQILQGAHPQAKLLADQMARVRANSIDVAKHTKFGAVAVTDVTRQLIQGGLSLGSVLGPKGAALAVETLAETQHTDPATTAADLANVGHSYQLSGQQYAGAADLIARASVTASGSLTELMYNLGRVGAIAHTAGIPLDQTLAALETLAPLGEQGGSDLAAVVQTMEDARMRGTRYMRAFGLDFFDKQGKYIGLDASIERLQKAMSKMPTDKARLQALGLIFQAGGSAAASLLIAPPKPGAKSYEEIRAAIPMEASLAQQRAVWAQGLTAQTTILGSATQATLSTLFNPALTELTSLTRALTQLTSGLGRYAEGHTGLSKAVTFGGAALAVGIGGFGIWQILKGLGAGGRMLRGIGRSLFGTAAGVAEGKALEGIAGVTPVFVVNWPGQTAFAGLGRGGAGSVSDAVLGGMAAKKILKGTPALLRMLRVAGVGSVFGGGLGVTGIAAGLGGVSLAGAAGYGVGSLIEHLLPARAQAALADTLGKAIAVALSPFSGTARDALHAGEGHLKITIDAAGRANVQQLSVQGGMPQITVDTGPLAAASAP